MEGEESRIGSVEFSAKWKDWIAVKKLTIREDTKPEEVAFSLASIRQSIDRKAFEIFGEHIDIVGLDSYASKIASNRKKNFKDMADVILQLSSTESKKVVENSCSKNPDLKDIASTYLFRKVVQALGFDFDVNQEMLAKIYKELKLPKPRGRQPKK
jgi:hypothetical protein